MPTLTRLLTVLALLAGFAYGSVFALAHFVTPRQTEISIDVPLNLPAPGQTP
jgi:hypothetical protein